MKQAIKEWIPDDEPDSFDQSPTWQPDESPLGDGRVLVLEST